MVDIKIVASRQRQEMAENLRDTLELTDQDIFYDKSTETGNPYLAVKQTWLLHHEEGVTNRVVLMTMSRFVVDSNKSLSKWRSRIRIAPFRFSPWPLMVSLTTTSSADWKVPIFTMTGRCGDVPFCCQSVSSKNAATISIPCLETMLWKALGFSAFSDTNRFQYYPRFR